ncbi:MAG: hypothetical protein V4596_11270 [Bdellovibrionota bacterium]
MKRRSLICHSVVVLVILISLVFSVNAKAGAPMCSMLFEVANHTRILEFPFPNQWDLFTRSEVVMDSLVQGKVLAQLKTSNPSRDHIEFFANQLPLLAQKLTINMSEAQSIFKRTEKPNRSKDSLKRNLGESYEKLMEEASSILDSRTVTYEWYMNYFLKSIIFMDVSLRVMESTSSTQFEMLNKKLDILLGNSKAFYSENQSETMLYSTLGKEFSSLIRDAYFTKHLRENTLVPVLFAPKDADIIEAERLGMHFVSLSTSIRETVDGLKYPLQFAARQVEQSTSQSNSFKDLIHNNKAKWIKYHDKIAAQVIGDIKLEALYAYILTDAGLQAKLTSRFETGYRLIFAFNVHKASDFLQEYLRLNYKTVKKIADLNTIESFLRIIRRIEKEALASPSYK